MHVIQGGLCHAMIFVSFPQKLGSRHLACRTLSIALKQQVSLHLTDMLFSYLKMTTVFKPSNLPEKTNLAMPLYSPAHPTGHANLSRVSSNSHLELGRRNSLYTWKEEMHITLLFKSSFLCLSSCLFKIRTLLIG